MSILPFVQKQFHEVTKAKKSAEINTLVEQGLANKSSDVFSYSGSDVICLVYIPEQSNGMVKNQGYIEIEEKLQTLTVSSARSVSPVRRLGETTPTAYTRGSRTIAGSMVFTTGLRDAFINALSKSAGDGEPMREPVLFVDQLPKFSMVLQANNELGGISTAMLVNITLTNFGTTFSIDDIYTESTFTYVAEQYMPLSQTLGNNRNEIAELIRQRQEAVEPTINYLIENNKTNKAAAATNTVSASDIEGPLQHPFLTAAPLEPVSFIDDTALEAFLMYPPPGATIDPAQLNLFLTPNLKDM